MRASTANWLGAALICLALWPSVAVGESSELSNAHDKTGVLLEQGRYAEALPHALRALELAEQELGPNDPKMGLVLNRLAEIYQRVGRYSDAVPLYRRALTAFESA